MAGETKALAQFATALRYDDIPPPVIAITKACLLDTVGVALFCSKLPWSRSVADFAGHTGGNGASTILSASLPRVSAPAAALANGTSAHAFEFDNLRQPSVGVHPGATAHVGALAVAEEYKVSGRDFLTALVAGCEGMLRVGAAAKQTSEEIGFHAPGLTGVFGAAIAAAKLMGQDARKTTMAIGIGASLCSGLLAFVRAGNGGMVKRLHMGRAAEGGVTAAYLAGRDFEGPDVALEGKFGFLDTYARDGAPALLTEGLGSRWDSLHIWFKMFPCHVTAQAPVRAVRELMRMHRFAAADVTGIVLQASPKVLTHHADTSPRDVGTAQYSVPFCIALSLYRDPADPQSFLDGPDQDPAILELCKKVELRPLAAAASGVRQPNCRLEIRLRDSRTLSIDDTALDDGNAESVRQASVEAKFRSLTAGFPETWRDELLDRLNAIENEQNVAALFAP
jgi:2-methylcitrate dehydratase PrpD